MDGADMGTVAVWWQSWDGHSHMLDCNVSNPSISRVNYLAVFSISGFRAWATASVKLLGLTLSD
jgi:hypothetical protein